MDEKQFDELMKDLEEKKDGDWSIVVPLLLTVSSFGHPKEDTVNNTRLREQVAYLNGKVDILEKLIVGE